MRAEPIPVDQGFRQVSENMMSQSLQSNDFKIPMAFSCASSSIAGSSTNVSRNNSDDLAKFQADILL
jgi:hypothetical protein